MNERKSLDVGDYGAICGDPDVAQILRVHPDWVELWERKGHLKSLGGRTKGCQRYYSTRYVLGLCEDLDWLDKGVRLVRTHFKGKNAK